MGSYAADPDNFDDEKALFLKEWGRINVELFVNKVLTEDIQATNGKDEDEQLESLNRLTDTLKTLHEVSGPLPDTPENANLDPVRRDTWRGSTHTHTFVVLEVLVLVTQHTVGVC